MSLTFYCLSGSPFSWKVWLSLERKQIAYDLEMLSADAGDLKSPRFLALNPRGKVPTIVDEGFVLSESAAIVDYLEERYPESGASLWPGEVRARALARKAAIEGDSFIYPSVRKLVEECVMRKDGDPDACVVADAKAALASELARLATSIKEPFIAGPEPSAADFTIYPFLAVLRRLAARRPEHRVGEVVPGALSSWIGRVEALPYFEKTTPPHWRKT